MKKVDCMLTMSQHGVLQHELCGTVTVANMVLMLTFMEAFTYYYENIRIPPKYHQAVADPELLTVEEVLKHTNQEVRYVGIKIVGFDRIMKHKNCKIIDRDEKKGQVLFTISGIFEEPVAYVKVINSTAEPDGSFKNYFLCVPPPSEGIKSCAAAVAWTFGFKNAEDYHPEQET